MKLVRPIAVGAFPDGPAARLRMALAEQAGVALVLVSRCDLAFLLNAVDDAADAEVAASPPFDPLPPPAFGPALVAALSPIAPPSVTMLAATAGRA